MRCWVRVPPTIQETHLWLEITYGPAHIEAMDEHRSGGHHASCSTILRVFLASVMSFLVSGSRRVNLQSRSKRKTFYIIDDHFATFQLVSERDTGLPRWSGIELSFCKEPLLLDGCQRAHRQGIVGVGPTGVMLNTWMESEPVRSGGHPTCQYTPRVTGSPRD